MARGNRSASKSKRFEGSVSAAPASSSKRLSVLRIDPSTQADAAQPLLQIARVVSVDGAAIFVQLLSEPARPRPARCLVGLVELQPDDQVVVVRVGVDETLVVLGALADKRETKRDVKVNGKKIEIEADAELVLKCAAATIRIRRDGMVSVRGDRIAAEARGAHRIRGGSVEIN